jgi:hypothetical protein
MLKIVGHALRLPLSAAEAVAVTMRDERSIAAATATSTVKIHACDA